MQTNEATKVPDIEFTVEAPAQAVTVVAPAAPPVPTGGEVSPILGLIERASRDPNVDIDKMERLIAMHERVQAEAARVEFDNAMAAAQAEMQPIRANMDNPQTKSEYADQAALDRAIRPIYTKHGFSLSFNTASGAPADCVRIVCIVAHRGGHREPYQIDMPADGKGAKGGDVMTKTHAAGAAQQYGMRYLLKGIFNVAIGEDDTDGNEPGETLSEQQVADLKALITEVGADMGRLLKLWRVQSLDQILAVNYQTVMDLVKAKRK